MLRSVALRHWVPIALTAQQHRGAHDYAKKIALFAILPVVLARVIFYGFIRG
jgi:hypothetical protein